jgi:regulator of protease activity HflC (stomatin/prohibitin superfamily)
MEFFLLVIGVFILVTLVAGVKIINQGDEALVERLGRFHAKLAPGLSIVIPYIDQIVFKGSVNRS